MDYLVFLYAANDLKHVYHVYAARLLNRDDLLKYLVAGNIYAGIHYPVPVHMQSAHSNMGFNNNGLKISERVASELLFLQMYPELPYEQLIRVKNKIQQILSS